MNEATLKLVAKYVVLSMGLQPKDALSEQSKALAVGGEAAEGEGGPLDEASAPQPNANGQFAVGPDGTSVSIPPDYVAEPAEKGNSIVYRPARSTGNANAIRVMGPDAEGR